MAKRNQNNHGLMLMSIMVIVLILALIGTAVLTVAGHESVLSKIEADKAKAFYLAEAGLGKIKEKLVQQQTFSSSEFNDVISVEGTLDSGTFRAILDLSKNPCYVVATGTAGNLTKKIQAKAIFLAPPLEHAIYANNDSSLDWSLQLRGKGNPVVSKLSGIEQGGKDTVNGNVFIDGDAYLFEESSVNAAPLPNTYNLSGDVEATGNISIQDSAKIAGKTTPKTKEKELVDLKGMNYVMNNTHNVSQIFEKEGIISGYLPKENILRDVFVKNPTDRSAECKTTAVNDYFFEPSKGFIGGDYKTAPTPLHAGQDRIYYVDGDVWIHSKNDTYGFNMNGKVTIVATGNIHICDNLKYADDKSMLGLIALGKYDDSGNITSGGNIYFGDPAYGTMYTVSGMMFAAKDFLFNTNSITGEKIEPKTGFTVYGNFAAMGKVSLERDWYDKRTGRSTEQKPAHYDAKTKRWVDSETSVPLNTSEIGTLRHYQMKLNYDDRVRNPETQPPGLPQGGKKIFAGFTEWNEE